MSRAEQEMEEGVENGYNDNSSVENSLFESAFRIFSRNKTNNILGIIVLGGFFIYTFLMFTNEQNLIRQLNNNNSTHDAVNNLNLNWKDSQYLVVNNLSALNNAPLTVRNCSDVYVFSNKRYVVIYKQILHESFHRMVVNNQSIVLFTNDSECIKAVNVSNYVSYR